MLCHLHGDDHDGFLILGHELLLLACSRCCWKRGGGQGSCCTGPTPLDRLPMCTFETLECAVRVADMIQLEHLVWVVFDNIMGPGEAPPLSGLEMYAEIIECLAGKAYRCNIMSSCGYSALPNLPLPSPDTNPENNQKYHI